MEPVDSTTPDPGIGRVALIAVGACLVLLALVALGGGAILVGVHTTRTDANGFYKSAANPLSTRTRALVTDNLAVDTGGADWAYRQGHLGTIRVAAQGTAGKPIFVGVGTEQAVRSYLRGVAREEIQDFEVRPFSVTTMVRHGDVVPAAPASRKIWSASTSGNGRQTLTWRVREGDWSVVVMNADGSANVSTRVSVGAKLGLLLWVGVGLLAFGAVMAVGGSALIVAGGRRRPAGQVVADRPSTITQEAT
jgi:hypothetical protein